MLNFPLNILWMAVAQTLYMIFVSGFLSIIFGLIFGILLFITQKDKIFENKIIYQGLNFLVNITRSIPYIILMIAIIPFTRLIIGTSIGTNAAIVSLTLAAIPFYARICEAALTKVPTGVIEAAQSMGASHPQIITKVLVPEALSGLIQGATLTVISLIGYSAMAGVVGGGGLGELAVDYGYQQFNPAVMLITVLLLIIIVQIVQMFGDYLAKQLKKVRVVVLVAILLFLSCIIGQTLPFMNNQTAVFKVGIVAGPQQVVMQVAAQVAKQQYNLNLKIVTFDDYILPNEALNNGDIEANIFQHVPYLDSQIHARGYQLVPIAKTFIYPMGLYSRKITSLDQLSNEAVIAIPDDPSNEARALLLLEKANLIVLKSGKTITATIYDIAYNPKQLKIITLDAAQLPREFKDADLVALTNDYVKQAGFTLIQALVREGPNSPYANIIVVRKQDQNKTIFKQLIAVMHSPQVVSEVEKLFPNGAAVPAWQ
ncbi:MAG: hypothetical protein A3E87_03595 [Gammaproteobacteria bacterium RIFCSPHIGHO2_12_FULL_35_23]|nr:MAG: hypothetical protein A3E87_03595 [Gammaproteobacteria bacterium RIFCSPHIGHO2_12_FULL_35_23]